MRDSIVLCCSPPVIEEPKEPVDPAVRAKENWLRLYNKVLEQLREVRSRVHPESGLKFLSSPPPQQLQLKSWSHSPDSAPAASPRDIPEVQEPLKVSSESLKYICAVHYSCEDRVHAVSSILMGLFYQTPGNRLNVFHEFQGSFLLFLKLKVPWGSTHAAHIPFQPGCSKEKQLRTA